MKPKVPRPWRVIDVPLYGGQVAIYTDRLRMIKALHGLSVDAEVGAEGGSCLPLERTDGVIYLAGWYDGKRPTLVHEMAHASLFILTRAGIDPRDSQGEAFAYLLEHLVNELL